MFFVFSLYGDKINLPTYLCRNTDKSPTRLTSSPANVLLVGVRKNNWYCSNNKKMPIFSRELLATMKKKEATVNF